jgi:hypothetical protein
VLLRDQQRDAHKDRESEAHKKPSLTTAPCRR